MLAKLASIGLRISVSSAFVSKASIELTRRPGILQSRAAPREGRSSGGNIKAHFGVAFMKRLTTMPVVLIASVILAYGQGFSNLNFESAYDLPANPDGEGELVPVTSALPDWTAYEGSLALSEIYYVSNTLGNVSGTVEREGGSLALSGNNLSVGLYDGGSISQTAMVPGNAESLDFEAFLPGPAANLVVTLGGQKLSYSALYDGPNYIEYGANIPSAMEGQTEALIFSCNEGPGSGGAILDNIQFSPSATPEPGEMALIGLGAVLFYMSKRRKQSGAGNEDG